MIIAGMDEAGRGSLFGPLIVSLVVFESKDKLNYLSYYSELQDSKKISAKKREQLFKNIKNDFSVFYEKITPKEIDSFSINDLECRALNKMLIKAGKNFNIDELYIDLFTSESKLKNSIKSTGIKKIIAEHKADSTYKIVSAASIIAKVIRDTEIKKLHKKIGNFGSGYPSDWKSIEFFKKNKALCLPHIRKKWKTYSNEKQLKLSDF